MHQGNVAAVLLDGIFHSRTHQTFRTFFADRLDADAAGFGETDLGDVHFFLQKFDHLLSFGSTGGPFDTGVNIFGVFAEDHHIGLFGFLDG